jgi:hypothetical protein
MPGIGSFILVMLLALMAPVLALVGTVLAWIPRTRRRGAQSLLSGFIVASSLTVGWAILSMLFHVPFPYNGPVTAICFGAFFTVGFVFYVTWRIVRGASRQAHRHASA